MENNALTQTETATHSPNGPTNRWTVEEKRALAAVTFPIIEMQKAYGRQIDARVVMQGWEIKFAGRFTIHQLLFALDKYTDERDDFPTPANLIKILEPKEPEVSQAEFIAAQDWQKRNNYPMLSDAKDTIDRYHRQQKEQRQAVTTMNAKILELAQASVQRLISISDANDE